MEDDFTARFNVDISAVRGAFGNVKKMATDAVGATRGSGQAFAGPIAGARQAAGAFAAAGSAATAATGRFASARGAAAAFYRGVLVVGNAGQALGGIQIGLSTVTKWFRQLRGTGPAALNQTAAAANAATGATRAATVATGALFGRFAKGAALAATAATAVWGLTRAWRALSSTRQPELRPPRVPSASGAGLGGMLKPLAMGAALGLGGAGLFGVIKDQVAGALKGAADAEQVQISFEVLAGGLAPAKKALGEIRALAENTPLRFADLAGAGRSLLAFGESGDALADTLRRIGDISSGVQAPIGEIAEIYGKARVQGTLFAEDINQLTGRGINVLTEFANVLGTTPDQIKKLASEGQITFPMLERAFQNLTAEGGQFAGMLARQSQTVAGLWSTLQDRIKVALTALGTPINDALRPLLKEAVELAGGLKDRASDFGAAIARAIDFVRAAFQTLSGGEIFQAIGKGLAWAFQVGLDTLIRGVTAVVRAFQDAEFLSGLEVKLQGIFGALKDTLLAAVEAALRAMGDLPGIGENMTNAADSLEYQRKIDRMNADAAARAREREGKPEVDLTGVIAQYFREAKGIFGGSSPALLADLEKLNARIAQEASRLRDERESEKNKANADAEQKNRDALIPPGAGGALTGNVVGAFQRAVNLIGGGTVNELIANEAKKTNALLEQTAKTAEETKRAAQDTARNTAKTPTVKVDVTSVFA